MAIIFKILAIIFKILARIFFNAYVVGAPRYNFFFVLRSTLRNSAEEFGESSGTRHEKLVYLFCFALDFS